LTLVPMSFREGRLGSASLGGPTGLRRTAVSVGRHSEVLL
jgi:hypothetical protein